MRALLLVLLAGCGLAPQDDFGGRQIGDGIAPWEDLGPVSLCLANQRIGPPASPPGGLCRPNSVVEALCLSDSDCASRETCVCGGCTVAYCSGTADCAGGRTCTFAEHRCDVPCVVKSDCAAGEQCLNGACRGRCSGDADCQTGEVCSSASGRCVVADCADAGDCLAGELCRVQRVPRVATEPSVLARAGAGEPAFVMWLELSDQLQQERRAIWRATSPDGLHYRFEPAAPVLADADQAHAPSVVRVDGDYLLYYEYGDGAELRVARSADGIAFAAPQRALGGGAVRAPAALALGAGEVAVYYQIGDGEAIGLATGPAGGALTALRPALGPADVEDPPSGADSTQFWIDVGSLRSPHALLAETGGGEPVVRLWFSGFGKESGDSYQFGDTIPIPPSWSIGYASASPGAPGRPTVWPYNPVLDRISAFLDHHGELAPAAVQATDELGQTRERYLLYVVDADPDGANPSGLAAAGNGEPE